MLYKSLRQHLGEVFRKPAKQKESWIEEGHLQTDHVHRMISISLQVCGLASGGVYQGRERNLSGQSVRRTEAEPRRQNFLARGYFVSTAGRNEATIWEYIRNQGT